MHALAERKANVNAVGIIGLVENMPSGSATRPGDIVTAHSGQTVEILNTDAEGRLVLADLISYVQERFKPRLMIDLATLTGAIMVALGKEYAGLFANDDKLAGDLLDASLTTGEKMWRMPLDKAYDKMVESKNADIKNIGGRWAGACTAAAFLKYFVKDYALGSHRSRGHGDGCAEVGDQSELGLGLGRAPARPLRRRQVREVGKWPLA